MTHHSILINPPAREVVHDLNQHAHQQEVGFKIATLSLNNTSALAFLTDGRLESVLTSYKRATIVLSVDPTLPLAQLQEFIQTLREWTIEHPAAPVAFYWQLTAIASEAFAPQFVAALMPLVQLDTYALRATGAAPSA